VNSSISTEFKIYPEQNEGEKAPSRPNPCRIIKYFFKSNLALRKSVYDMWHNPL